MTAVARLEKLCGAKVTVVLTGPEISLHYPPIPAISRLASARARSKHRVGRALMDGSTSAIRASAASIRSNGENSPDFKRWTASQAVKRKRSSLNPFYSSHQNISNSTTPRLTLALVHGRRGVFVGNQPSNIPSISLCTERPDAKSGNV